MAAEYKSWDPKVDDPSLYCDLKGMPWMMLSRARTYPAEIYQTAERQTFHTDSCDIVGLLCLQTAKEGGHSALVSTGAVWNAVLQQRPDLAAALLQPVATDRRGEVPPGQQPFFTIPVLNWFEGRLSGIYHRSYVDSAQRFADAP